MTRTPCCGRKRCGGKPPLTEPLIASSGSDYRDKSRPGSGAPLHDTNSGPRPGCLGRHLKISAGCKTDTSRLYTLGLQDTAVTVLIYEPVDSIPSQSSSEVGVGTTSRLQEYVENIKGYLEPGQTPADAPFEELPDCWALMSTLCWLSTE